MIADLVHRQVAVIAATTTPAALAAKAATKTIPIVFESGTDPVQLGLVDSLNRPGGNITGVSQLIVETASKRLELLHELVPNARVIGLLVNQADAALAQAQLRTVSMAANSLGLELQILNASSEHDFDAAFANLTRLHAGGLVISAGPVFLRGMELVGCPNSPPRRASNLPISRIRSGGRFDELRAGHYRIIPYGWHLYRPNSQR
jgi:putative ABC transport system substrate-binding protein